MVCACVVCGCETSSRGQRRNADVRRESELETMQIEVQRLQDRVQALETSREELSRQLDSVAATSQTGGRDLEDRLQRLERNLRALDSERERMKQEIVASLSRKMAELMRAQAPRPGPGDSGYEHVVKTGETLSAIAAAYDVSVRAIMQANNIKDANLLKVGQKLFIPE